MAVKIPTGACLVRRDALPRGELSLVDPASLAAKKYGGARKTTQIQYTREHHAFGDYVACPWGTPEALDLDPNAYLRHDLAQQALPSKVPFRATLRSYQVPAVASAARKRCGVIVAPPGAGKTVMALALIHRLKLRPLVLVHTHDLLRQWQQATCDLLGAGLRPISGTSNPDSVKTPIGTVAMVQSLARWTPAKLQQLALDHGVLILDEAHHCPAETFNGILWYMGTPRRYGLTATPQREDGLTRALHWTCGPTVATITHDDLVEAGSAVIPTIHPTQTNFEFEITKRLRSQPAYYKQVKQLAPHEVSVSLIADLAMRHVAVDVDEVSPDEADRIQRKLSQIGVDSETFVSTASLTKCYQAMTEDRLRLTLICRLTEQMFEQQRKTLVLAGRIEYCSAIADELNKQGSERSVVLTSKVSPKQRQERLAAFRDGNCRCCIATTLADEGLDVPDISALIMAFPGRAKGRTIQRVGRTMRVAPGKESPVVYDLVDSQIPLMRNQWLARRRAYLSVGYQIDDWCEINLTTAKQPSQAGPLLPGLAQP